ncbi:MAG: cobalt-precorrin-5B (C(1))-methyltransferase CbiD, partial [Lachnospiraceae bacterium]|nr:cobalt-precorrin-5B (C(1))-methyltransferase CbiD [Lachnospiraceae bacterium]
KVIISVPGGKEIALKTFNPKLGIEGGISIIGTSGIVEPMSTKALLDTIKLELKQRKELGYDYAAVSPGNYGLDFMRDTYGYDLDRSVKCSNYIGDTIDMAVELGFKDFLYVGHIGKLIKVAGGIMNTHSKEADCRMEILTAIGCQHDVTSEILKKIMECVTTEEACKLLKECNKCDEVCLDAAKRICANLEKRAQGDLKVECVMFSKELGELSKSVGAESFINRLVSEL